MQPDPPRWLDIAKSKGCLVWAPLLPAVGPGSLLAPVVVSPGPGYAANLLGLSAVPLSVLGDILGSALGRPDAVTDGLNAIFRGHPVGLPLL